MPIELIFVKLVLLVFLLGFSAFFSGSETALFSLDAVKIKHLSQRGKNTSAIVRLLENPLRCLTTILAGNTLVNIAISSIVTTLSIDIVGDKGVGLSIGVTTVLLLVFGEVTPKTIAIYNNERFAYAAAGPLYVFQRVLSPFLFLATNVCDRIITYFHWGSRKEPTLTEEEFRTVMTVGHRHGVVGKNEKEMIESILELTTTTVAAVMTPRTDIGAVSVDWPRERVLAFAREARFSKIPVYKDNLDNITGFFMTKELFLEATKPWLDLVRPISVIPRTKKISDLMKDFTKERRRIALVVDEYGGVSGLVTMENVLREIFGEVQSEFRPRLRYVEALGTGRARLLGKTPLDQVREACGVEVPPGRYETLAGYLLDVAGRLPVAGDRLSTPLGLFVIERVSGRRIQSVLWERA